MIRFNKKMVKGIIDILSSEPCKSRLPLQTIRIKKDGCAYITNGYMVIKYKFDTEPIRKDDGEEFVIPLDNLKKWYKEAKSKDYLDELGILNLMTLEDYGQYPDMPKLINEKLKDVDDRGEIKLDTKLLGLFSKCCDDERVKINTLINKGLSLQSIRNPKITGILMELY